MIVLTPPHINTAEEALLAFINLLRDRHAMDQHMLQSRPMDERLRDQRDEVRAKNTALEQENRNLRHENNNLRAAVEAATLAKPKVERSPRVMSNADGEAAIVAGREAAEAHKRLTEQPARGE